MRAALPQKNLFSGGILVRNLEVKEAIKKARLYQYQIAQKLGITEITLCVWFRSELSPDRKEKILNAIAELVSEGSEA